MPRNRKKFTYITIGLPNESPILQRLQEESKRSGTSPSKLIPVKLDELYSGSTQPVKPEPITQAKGAEANALAFLDGEED